MALTKRSRGSPPTRADDYPLAPHDGPTDPKTDEALRALVLILARQAARETFESECREIDPDASAKD